MAHSWHVRELAIFHLEHFVFGVDTHQIQEIFIIKDPQELTQTEQDFSTLTLRHKNQSLAVCDLRPNLCLSVADAPFTRHASPITIITFYKNNILIASWVDAVENIISVSLRSLKPVPPFLTPIARKSNLWGFYELPETLIPLFDLQSLVNIQNFNLPANFPAS